MDSVIGSLALMLFFFTLPAMTYGIRKLRAGDGPRHDRASDGYGGGGGGGGGGGFGGGFDGGGGGGGDGGGGC